MLRRIIQTIAIALFCVSGTAYANTPAWVLSEKRGTVNVERAGISKAAVSGGSLRAGDVISTGKKSRAVLVRGGEYVVISPNSRLRIAKPKTRNGVVQFFEEVGSVLFRIDKKSTPHFGVDTPYLAAVVKGTTFSVTVSESGTAVQVTEGAVQVATRDGGATQLLSPGMIGMVEASQQFRLNIAGPENRVIDSPNAPAGSKATPKPMSEAKLVSIASKSLDGTISKSAPSRPVSLAKATGGMISGTVSALKPSAPAVNTGTAIAGARSAQPAVAVQAVLAGNGNSAANSADSSNGNSGNAISGSIGDSSSVLGAALIASNQAVAAPRQNAIANAAAGNGAGNGANMGVGNAIDDSVTSGGVVMTGGANGIGNGATNGNSGGNGNGNGGGQPINYGGDQPNGSCAGVSNCVSGPNPNGNGNSGNGNGNGATNGNTGGAGNGNSDGATNGNVGGNGNGNGLGDGNNDDPGAGNGGNEAPPENPTRSDVFRGIVIGLVQGYQDWRNNRGNNANGPGGPDGGSEGGQGNGNQGNGNDDDDDEDDDEDDDDARGNGQGNNGNGNGGNNSGDD